MVDLIFQIVKPRLAADKEHSEIEQVRIGSSKESLDNVGDNTLTTCDVISMFGHYLKYYVKCRLVTEAQPVVNAFEIIMQAQAARNLVNLPQPLVVKNKLDQLNNYLLCCLNHKDLCGRQMKYMKELQVELFKYYEMCCGTSMVLTQHCMSEVATSQRFLRILKVIIHRKITSIINDKSIHCQERTF